MAPTEERREHSRRASPKLSHSPTRDHHSPRRRMERSPAHLRSSPRMRSPVRTTSSHRIKSPARDQDRSPKRTRPRSPPKNTSPSSLSPRTRRLRRAQAERDVEKVADRDHGRDAREERDKGRHKERGEGRDVLSDKRLARDKNGDGSSRSSRRERSISPEEHSPKRKYNSHSPPMASKAGPRHEPTKSGSAEKLRDDDHDSIAKMKSAEEALEAKKQKPSFELSGKLAEETNRVRGVTLLFTEPPDARKPNVRWRLYVFKAGEVLNEPLYVHRQSCYLFGRERRVADIPTDHPSCSKQHAVIQFRLTEKEQPDGLLSKQVRPYIMDLGSTNGTFVNENRIESQRYYELFEKDTIKFGNSSREYVILHEDSAA